MSNEKTQKTPKDHEIPIPKRKHFDGIDGVYHAVSAKHLPAMLIVAPPMGSNPVTALLRLSKTGTLTIVTRQARPTPKVN